MKAMLFRLLCALTSLLCIGFWIETKSFDAIDFAVSIVLGVIFIVDFITWTNNFSGTPYHNTSMGSITWVLFKPKNK